MELIRGLHNLRDRHRGCVATIGAFDGVHRGHQAVIQQLLDQGKALGLPTTVVVFEPLPREYFNPVKAPPRLLSFREKYVLFKALGVDRVLRVRFTAAFQHLTAEQFIQQLFVDGLAAQHIIVGDDWRFGRDRAGDFDLLKSVGAEKGFAVSNTDTFSCQDQRVSSTRIRQALQDADFELAELLLGRPYSIAGKVIMGRQLGRQLDAPTANLELHRIRTALSGVYAVDVEIEGELHRAIANVGTRPTVDDSLKAILEIHILDFKRDIYRKNISAIFRHKIRDEQKFDSVELLKTQIHRDIQHCRQWFETAAVS